MLQRGIGHTNVPTTIAYDYKSHSDNLCRGRDHSHLYSLHSESVPRKRILTSSQSSLWLVANVIMGSFNVPRCAFVQFPTLVDLAQNETDGLMRGISEPAVSIIRQDMLRVGVVKGKFGRPTINISCHMSDNVYRSLFLPVPPGGLQLVNEEINFLDLAGIPVLLPTIQVKSHLTFTDGRHRVIACSRVAGTEEFSKQFVLCFITNIKDSLSMKQDSFRKSEVRPLVFDSIHDVLVCLPQWESGDTSKIRQVMCNTLKISDDKQADKIELLHCHIFRESRRLLDTHRDSNLFSRENVFKRGSTPFISFIKETGKGQYSGYRYEFRSLFKPESGLKAREILQNGVILAMIYFAKCDSSIAPTNILANAPKLAMTQMKKYTRLSETDLIKFFVELLAELNLFFRIEAVDNGPLSTKSNLELTSCRVIVEGLGFDMASLQDFFNDYTISNTSMRPRSSHRHVDVTSKRMEKNANSGAPSRDSGNKVSAKTVIRKRKRNENVVDDRINKKKKQCNPTLHVLPSPRALCAAKCLDFAEEVLKDVSFSLFKCREKRYVIDGMRKRENLSNAILFTDATFLRTGKLEEAVIALSRCNVEVKKILFWSTEAIMENSIQVPGFSLRVESELVVNASQSDGNLGTSYFAGLLLPPGASYEGPRSTKNVFNTGVCEAKVFEWFFSTTFSGTRKPSDLQCPSWVDFTTHSQVVVLEHLMEHNFGVSYYKILKDGVNQELKNLDCLLALRRKVSTLCSCGGHSILSASNQAILNDLGENTYGDAVETGGEYPFIMYGHGEDKMPHGNVMEHPSLLLKKNMIGDTPMLTRDPKLLCQSRRDERGILLQRGAFVSRETFENLKSKSGSVELILPSNILVDRHTKREKYEFCISEFEMREWFVGGMTDQMFSVIFPDSSVASLLNEGTEHSEVSFTPRHRSVQYLDILFREGLQAVKCPERCLIYCKLDCSALRTAESRGLQCKNCNAIELLTHYGSEYVHD